MMRNLMIAALSVMTFSSAAQAGSDPRYKLTYTYRDTACAASIETGTFSPYYCRPLTREEAKMRAAYLKQYRMDDTPKWRSVGDTPYGVKAGKILKEDLD
jgi:hypothetical protein